MHRIYLYGLMSLYACASSPAFATDTSHRQTVRASQPASHCDCIFGKPVNKVYGGLVMQPDSFEDVVDEVKGVVFNLLQIE